MTGASHERFRELISDRVDGPLATAEAAELDAHLAACSACRRADRDFRTQRAALRGLPSPQPPRDLWARTSVALDREVTRRRIPAPPAMRGSRRAVAATAASVLIVALVVAVPLAPLITAPGPASGPTPYAIEPSDLVFAAHADGGNVSIVRATVDEVCPAPRVDCTLSSGSQRVADVGAYTSASGFEVDPEGAKAVLIGVDAEGHANYEIVVIGGTDNAVPTEPAETPDATDASPPASGPSGTPTGTPEATPRTATPTDTPDPPDVTPPAEQTPGSPTPSLGISPPASPTDPLGADASRPILSGVMAAGMPAAWSSDGTALAFSARPASGDAGPDIYVWRPGDETATPVTHDGRSYFASWAGNRIVGSRASLPDSVPDASSSVRAAPESFVLDLDSLEQRPLRAPGVWLPAVDPTGTYAVSWRGRLAVNGPVAAPVVGRLFLDSWAAQDPFATLPLADETAVEPTPTPLPTEAGSPSSRPDRRPLGRPEGIGLASVVEWEVRWAPDGRALGVWVAERPGRSAGQLAIVAIEPHEDAEPVLTVAVGPERAWRAFSVGIDRVAYVVPDEDDRGGELRVATWGDAGAGVVLIRRVQPGEALPAF